MTLFTLFLPDFHQSSNLPIIVAELYNQHYRTIFFIYLLARELATSVVARLN